MQFLQGRLAIKILQSKLFYWCTIPALVMGTLIIAYFSSIQDFPVFPNSQYFRYSFYSDSTAGGNSTIIRKLITDSIIQLDFKIGNKSNVSSYVGINIGPKEIKTVGLGRYNQMLIRLKGKGINGIGITLVTKNHLKKSEIKDQDILFYQIFKISPEVNLYQINVDRFEIPGWWGEANRFEDASIIKPDLKNLLTININSAFTPNDGQIQSIEISSILFSRNNKPLIILILGLELVFILLVFIAFYTTEKNRENKKIITIAYKPVENKNSETSKSDFIDFMNNNFQNCELTLDFVSSETGVSQRRITNDVQNQFGCNFKSYINRLRINESKRLLLETELNIGEIAFKVGFNNQSHFNRVFKSELQISPTEYRDKHKKR
jgi:AraC-like DNA-binding protein